MRHHRQYKMGKQSSKQRYFCKNCGIYFCIDNPSVSVKNRFVWFEKWISGKHTFEMLSKENGYSKSTLQIYFYLQLDEGSFNPQVRLITY